MAYERTGKYHLEDALEPAGNVMIDGLEVVEEQTVVLAPLEAVAVPTARASRRRDRRRRDGLG